MHWSEQCFEVLGVYWMHNLIRQREKREKTMNKYRFESGAVYKYNSDQDAYIFIGKLNGRTKKQFLSDYEGSW